VEVQLIPSIPEDGKTVFKRAKELYVFGFFRYDFFTVATHYACMTLESAIKNRYCQSFNQEVTILNKKDEKVRMHGISHRSVINLCRARKKLGWDYRDIRIDGDRFLFGMNDLLKWLVKNKVITEWDKKICEDIKQKRDMLSHPTFAFRDLPGLALANIVQVVTMINKIFYQ
jgi:hypothetical protein